jgi:hypothetical protein
LFNIAGTYQIPAGLLQNLEKDKQQSRNYNIQPNTIPDKNRLLKYDKTVLICCKVKKIIFFYKKMLFVS